MPSATRPGSKSAGVASAPGCPVMPAGAATRQRIARNVRRHPGASKSEICKALRLGWGTADHHLAAMARKGRVQLVREGRTIRVYPGRLDPDHVQWLSALQDEVCSFILYKLHEEPGLRLADLAAKAKSSRKTLSQQLRALAAVGAVRGEGQFHKRYYLHDGIEMLRDLAPRIKIPAPHPDRAPEPRG